MQAWHTPLWSEPLKPSEIGYLVIRDCDGEEPIVLWPGTSVQDILDTLGYKAENVEGVHVVSINPAVLRATRKIDEVSNFSITCLLGDLIGIARVPESA